MHFLFFLWIPIFFLSALCSWYRPELAHAVLGTLDHGDVDALVRDALAIENELDVLLVLLDLRAR